MLHYAVEYISARNAFTRNSILGLSKPIECFNRVSPDVRWNLKRNMMKAFLLSALAAAVVTPSQAFPSENEWKPPGPDDGN